MSAGAANTIPGGRHSHLTPSSATRPCPRKTSSGARGNHAEEMAGGGTPPLLHARTAYGPPHACLARVAGELQAEPLVGDELSNGDLGHRRRIRRDIGHAAPPDTLPPFPVSSAL